MTLSPALFGRFLPADNGYLGIDLHQAEILHLDTDAAFLLQRLHKGWEDNAILLDIQNHYEIPLEEARSGLNVFKQHLQSRGFLDPTPLHFNNAGKAKFKLEQYASALNIPVFATIELLTGCHLDCKHCYLPAEARHIHHNKGLETDQVFDILTQLKSMGSLFLKLTGGEIFLRKDIYEILQYAHDLGFVIELLTSATPIKEKHIARLSPLNIAKIQISLYAANSEIHDQITQKPESFTQSLTALQALKKAGLPVSVTTAAMADNFDHLPALETLCRTQDIPFSLAYPLSPEHSGDTRPLTQALRPEQTRALVKKDLQDFHPVPRDHEHPCSAGRGRIAINAQGQLTPCNNFAMPIGQIGDQPIQSQWDTSRALQTYRAMTRADLHTQHPTRDPVLLCPGENWAYHQDFRRAAPSFDEITAHYHDLKDEMTI